MDATLTLRALLLALAIGALASCVSTDALYAEYDDRLCPVVVEPATGAALAVVDKLDGSSFSFPSAVYFGYDSAKLDGTSIAELELALLVLERYPSLNLALSGFTSKLGSRAYNLKLAGWRVDSIRSWLGERGVSGSRLSIQPIGQGVREFSSDERVANAVNRRVGLTLLDASGRPVRPSIPVGSIQERRTRDRFAPASDVSQRDGPTDG